MNYVVKVNAVSQVCFFQMISIPGTVWYHSCSTKFEEINPTIHTNGLVAIWLDGSKICYPIFDPSTVTVPDKQLVVYRINVSIHTSSLRAYIITELTIFPNFLTAWVIWNGAPRKIYEKSLAQEVRQKRDISDRRSKSWREVCPLQSLLCLQYGHWVTMRPVWGYVTRKIHITFISQITWWIFVFYFKNFL